MRIIAFLSLILFYVNNYSQSLQIEVDWVGDEQYNIGKKSFNIPLSKNFKVMSLNSWKGNFKYLYNNRFWIFYFGLIKIYSDYIFWYFYWYGYVISNDISFNFTSIFNIVDKTIRKMI